MPQSSSIYDLHLHTCWSYDATGDLENHFRQAVAQGVQCIAITEHHVLDSQPEVATVSARYPDIRVIAAAELSVNTSIGDVDLLCYGFPEDAPERLELVLDAYHTWQQETGAKICSGLAALGLDYTDAHRTELLQSYRPERTIDVQGHTHVSNIIQREYFLQRGFIDNAAEYAELLSRAGEIVARPPYPAVDFVIPAVKELGVVVAIAHPHGYFAQGDRARMDAMRAECLLDGVECAHQNVPAEFTPVYRDYCVEHEMFSTGGSDSHSNADIETKFARHGGEDVWLEELLGRID